MKQIIITLAIFTYFGINSSIAADQSKNIIEFNQPEKFTDFSIHADRNEKDRLRLMDQLSGLMDELLSEMSNNTFNIMVNDVDMSGRFEFNGRNNEFIRVIKESDRTRLEFSYVIFDSNGKQLTKGDANLTDRNPLTLKRLSKEYRDTNFGNEMKMFKNWVKNL
ncbi:MAG: DUF3016 domain-containing protein [Marinicellaceae bacterium]